MTRVPTDPARRTVGGYPATGKSVGELRQPPASVTATRSTRYSVIDGNHCSSELGVHPFAPGINVDDPTKPDPRWCNVCGEAVADA